MQNGISFFFFIFKKGVKNIQFALQILTGLSEFKAEKEGILVLSSAATHQSATVMQLFTINMLSADRLKSEEFSSVDPEMNSFNFQI